MKRNAHLQAFPLPIRPHSILQENFLPEGTHATRFTYNGPGTASGNASYSKGAMTSDYASVTTQAGIYAGKGGFDVRVKENTKLTGAVLDSTASADTNTLVTGSLTMEDIQNQAEYKVKNSGIAYHRYGSASERDKHFNETGLTLDLLPSASDENHSSTRSAISVGTIQVTNQNLDIEAINRDTEKSLNKLSQIFDKKKIEERQQLARLFAKNANELLHYYDRDGKFDKALAHGIVAEFTSRIAGNGVGSGFAAGVTDELLINKIREWAGNDPAKAQWISAALGATVNTAIGKDSQTGSATAQYGTKWNAILTNNPGLYAYYDNFEQAKADLIEFVSNENIAIMPEENIGDLDLLLSMKEKMLIHEKRNVIPIATELTWAASLGRANYTFELNETLSKELSKSPKLRKVIKNYIYYNGTGLKDNISVFSKDLIFTLSDVKEELTSGDLEGAWIDFGATLGLHRAAVSFKAVYQGNHQYYVYGIVGDKYKFRESDTNYRSFLGLLNAMGVQWERRGSISPTNEFIEFQFIIEVPDE